MRILLVIILLSIILLRRQRRSPRPTTVTSPNGELIVRITPIYPDTGRYYSEAIVYQLDSSKFNHISTLKLEAGWFPVESFITDSGSFITIDNWANMGYGEVVTIYSKQGNIIGSYELDELYDTSAIELFWEKGKISNSSIWWRSSKENAFLDGCQLVIPDDLNGQFIINSQTGSFTYIKTDPYIELGFYKSKALDFLWISLVILGITYLVIMRMLSFKKTKIKNVDS